METCSYRKAECDSAFRLALGRLSQYAAKTVSGDGFTPAALTVSFGPK